jgi:hypothetical protein
MHGVLGLPGSYPNSAETLSPIQQRLRSVLDALTSRHKEDDELGQTDWGERWWLPTEQSELVRQQLKHAHVELLERTSDYEDAVRHALSYFVRHTVIGITLPSYDPDRTYLGERRGTHQTPRVWVNESNGQQYPLQHGDRPYPEADATGFEWGYPRHGPGALTRCILIDALDADLAPAEQRDQLRPGFFETFVLHYPRDQTFKLSRRTVHTWLKSIGKLTRYESRRELVAWYTSYSRAPSAPRSFASSRKHFSSYPLTLTAPKQASRSNAC